MSERVDGRILIHTQGNPTGAVQVYYADRSAVANKTTTTSTVWQEWVPKIVDGKDVGQFEKKGFDLRFDTTLSAAEAALAATGGLHLSWRTSGTGDGIAFDNDKVMTQLADGSFRLDMAKIPTATSYDYKLWYLDAQGREVIVDWNQAHSDKSAVKDGRSYTVLGREDSGSINGAKMTAGVYIGQLNNDNFHAGMQLGAMVHGRAHPAHTLHSSLGKARVTHFSAPPHLISALARA